MKFEFFSATDTGRYRTNNEDTVSHDASTQLVLLADGMGGYNAGEVASGMACQLIMSDLAPWLLQAANLAPDADVERAMVLCANKANFAIFNSASKVSDYNGMGTTLVMAVFRPNRVLVGHIGDSRAYLWRKGCLQQLTKDHSLLQEKIDAGLLTQEQADQSLNKNLLTRAMGIEQSVQLDVKIHDLQDSDLILLCSDGLTDMLKDHDINQVIQSQSDSISLANLTLSLIEAANLAGGRDNIGVCLVRAKTEPKLSVRNWWSFGT